jgi:hypothetical protein
VDGRALRTLRTLFLRPGKLTSEFRAGRRQEYSPPLRLYLVISVSFFVLVSWVASRGVLLDPGQDLVEDAALQARFMSDELPRMMFVLLPLFALLMKLVLPRRLYFDHLIFSLHLHSAAYVVLALMLPLEQIAAQQWLPLVAQVILFSYFLAYVLLSIRTVYGTSWLRSGLKTLIVLFGYMIIVSVSIETTSNFLILAD